MNPLIFLLIVKKKQNRYVFPFVMFIICVFFLLPNICLGKQLIIVPPQIQWSNNKPSKEILSDVNKDYQKAIKKLKEELYGVYGLSWDLIIYSDDIKSFYKNYENKEKSFLKEFMEENGSDSIITVLFCIYYFISSENAYQIHAFGYLYEHNIPLQSFPTWISVNSEAETITYEIYLSLFFDILNQGNFLVEPKL